MAGFIRLFSFQSRIKFWCILIVKRSEIPPHAHSAKRLCAIIRLSRMRNFFLIILIVNSFIVNGQIYVKEEKYLKEKYKHTESISSGDIQYLDKSIEYYYDSLFVRYLGNYDFYLIKCRGLICWMPDTFSSILIKSKTDLKYYLIEPIDRDGPDSITMSLFENIKIASQDKFNYCYSFARMVEKIGFSNPKINQPKILTSNIVQIKYFNDFTKDKLFRLINFRFSDLELLKEITIINPRNGFNYKQSKEEMDYINNIK